jgi:hypothetical protein
VKPGTKLKSQVCDTEIMLILCGNGEIACGGAPMLETRPAIPGTINPDFSSSSQMGKRYVNASGSFELLCVRPGKGSLSIDGIALTTKDAKPLPASD